MLAVVCDLGEIVMQSRGSNRHVVLANACVCGTELPRNLAGRQGDVTVRPRDTEDG